MTAEWLTAAGGLGLFLLGMAVMTRGLREVGGEALTRALRRFTKSPLSGCLTGAVGTAVLQSSSATTVAAVGFVSAGLLTFPQALGVIFGANIGTTVTGWLVALFGFKLDVGVAAYPVLLLGSLLHLVGRRRASAVGAAAAGFATLLLGIALMREGLAGFEGVLTPADFPPDSWLGRLALVGIGAAVTVVTQSSSAGVALAVTAVHAGSISFAQAAAMVVGMDVGTTVTAALATIGSSTAGRRTGFAHVVYNLMTGLCAFALLPVFEAALSSLRPGLLLAEPELALVGFHTTFNTLGVLLVLPVTRPFARLMERLVPSPTSELTRGLEPRLVEETGLALEAVLEALRNTARTVFRAVPKAHRATRQEAARSLQPVRAALMQIHGYLGQVASSPDRPELTRRRESMVRALDHLERLAARAVDDHPEGAPPEDVQREVHERRFREVLAHAVRDLDAAAAAEAGALTEDMRDAKERHRAELLQAVASGRLDAGTAFARLNAARQLRRIVHHVHRATHHLALASDPAGGLLAEDDVRAEVAPE